MKKSCVIILILSLLLTACGKSRQEEALQEDSRKAEIVQEDGQQTETVKETEKKNWVIEEQILPDADEAVKALIPQGGEIFAEEWQLVEETVYRVVTFTNSDDSVSEEEYFKGYCIQKLEAPYLEWASFFIAPEDWVEGEICTPWSYGSCRIIVTANGFTVLLKGENGIYIGEWNEENGTAVNKIDSSLLTTDDLGKYSSWWIGQEGDFILWNDDACIHMNNSFVIKDKLEREEGYYGTTVVENSQDGRIYFSYPAECQYDAAISGTKYTGIQIVSLDDGMKVLLSSMDIHSGGDDKICFTTETEGYLYQNLYISEFSLEEGKIDILYDFVNDLDYYDKMYNPKKPLKYMNIVNGIQGGYAREDGSHVLLVACGDGTWQIWQMREEEKKSGEADHEKEILEWATTISGVYTERTIARFNQQSEDYEVVLRLPDAGEDFEDFRTRIQAELAAGGGPDILSEEAVINVDDGARRGFLTDLTEYFAEYEDDMLPSVWKLGIVDGHRYAVPYAYTINTLVADKRLVGSKECWTLDEAMEYMENGDADVFLAGADTAGLFFYLGLLTETNSQLVDWQSNTSHLNSEKAVQLLEFAEKYADNDSSAGNRYLQAAEGKAAAALLYLMSPEDLRVAAAMFKDEEAYIGFPVENGESGHILYDSSLVVNQGSSNVEGAVAFIQFLLSEETQDDMAAKIMQNNAGGFPIRNSAMEQIYSYLQTEEDSLGKMNTYEGLEYESKPLTDESIQKLKELVNSARPMGKRANRMFVIVADEIENFRTEGKTTQQVLDNVNNRAQLYLDESEN